MMSRPYLSMVGKTSCGVVLLAALLGALACGEREPTSKGDPTPVESSENPDPVGEKPTSRNEPLSFEERVERRCSFQACVNIGTLGGCHHRWVADKESTSEAFKYCVNRGLDACFEVAMSMQDERECGPSCLGRQHARLDESCFAGHARSCDALGTYWRDLAEHSDGFDDRRRAACYYRIACDDGFAESCLAYLSVGSALGGRKRFQVYAERACEAGLAAACEILAFHWEHGWQLFSVREKLVDLIKAREYYSRACEDGFERSCYRLGIMWRDGQGGPVDLARARQYFERLCGYGKSFGPACEALIELGVPNTDPI
jgi:TPR repeat protein